MWSLSQISEEMLAVFKRTELRILYVPVRGNADWKIIQYNHELKERHGDLDDSVGGALR